MNPLTSAQRAYLRAEAHHLEPTVLVGKQGVTDMLIRSTAQFLGAHELVKIRFNDHKGEKRALTDEIAFRTGAQVVGILGHVATLYRPHPEPEKRELKLPGA